MSAPTSPVASHLSGTGAGAGPLGGVRTTVKELIAVAGVELTANTTVELPASAIAAELESPIVTRLRAAGASIESTSTTHELAWGITSWTGGRRVANPVVDGRVAGGSSGGAAALVAQGAADLGVGTDTAGSIRIPAGWCDLVGWKPTVDLVPTEHVLPLAPGFDTVGFLARDVDLLDRVADLLDVGDVEARPVRIAELRLDGAVRDRRLDRPISDSLDVLRRAGHEVVAPLVGPPAEATLRSFATLQLDASLRAHRDVLGTWPEQRARYGAAIRQRLTAAERLDEAEVAMARQARDELASTLAGWFDRVDALVLPTTGCEPPTQDRPDEVEVDGSWHDLRSVVLPHTVLANLTGAPAVSVPARVEGAPSGVQVLVPAGADRRALRLAADLMAAT